MSVAYQRAYAMPESQALQAERCKEGLSRVGEMVLEQLEGIVELGSEEAGA